MPDRVVELVDMKEGVDKNMSNIVISNEAVARSRSLFFIKANVDKDLSTIVEGGPSDIATMDLEKLVRISSTIEDITRDGYWSGVD